MFDTKRIGDIVKRDRNEALAFSNWLDIVMNYNVPEISKEFVDTTGRDVFRKLSLVTSIAGALSLIFILQLHSARSFYSQCLFNRLYVIWHRCKSSKDGRRIIIGKSWNGKLSGGFYPMLR